MKIKLKWIILGIVLVLAVFIVTFTTISYISYQRDIESSVQGGQVIIIDIESGETIDTVADELLDKKIIVSKSSFKLYANLNDKTNLIAGRYELSSGMTIPQILEIINSGDKADSFNITFLPGGTVKMAEKVLIKAGFSESAIKTALAKDYSSEFPNLFAGKPTEADLEGFIFGETYSFEKGTSVETVLKRVFQEMQKYVTELNLEEKYKAQGLTLYQGITLASIIQREVPGLADQKAVAGVFYNRMKAGMTLGSDVTYQYAADKMGVPRSTNLDSPYNLRRYTGLTPTPIATPGVSAMKAAADPDQNNYLYFLSGDDDKTYFGATNDEHEKNIIDHCKEKCKII